MKKGFTLLEIVVVIVILGVMAVLAMPAYNRAKELAFDNQVKADLKLMLSAEKNYYMDMNFYYPLAGGTDSVITSINSALSVTLSAGPDRRWDYSVKSVTSPKSSCCQATRFNGPNSRSWRIQSSETDVVSGTCP
jgi:prepilin-type N-terminal cleavage/methylation domain-containing protein